MWQISYDCMIWVWGRWPAKPTEMPTQVATGSLPGLVRMRGKHSK
jgi:hypothetical protein